MIYVLIFCILFVHCNPICGRLASGKLCPDGLCCSINGTCSEDMNACGLGCQSGRCRVIHDKAVPDYPITSSSKTLVTSSSKLSSTQVPSSTTTVSITKVPSSTTNLSSTQVTSSISTPGKCTQNSCLPRMTPQKDIYNQYMSCIGVGSVAITWDDGPDPVLTPQVLDATKQKNIKVTFFVVGQLVEAGASILKRMFNEGHEIAIHSYTRIFFTNLRS